MDDRYVSLAHGNGGRLMRELIEKLFARHLSGGLLDTSADAVSVSMPGTEIMITTDGFTVQPLEFPGGNIGSLAVHGTVNDLAVAGAMPLYLTVNAIIEEGFEIAQLDRIVEAMANAAKESGVRVVAGDTKVVPRGQGGGIYFGVTGVGVKINGTRITLSNIRPGDQVLLSGTIGDHGIAVMLAREQFGLKGDVRSDSASVLPLTQALSDLPGLRFMRDPTRGGLATVAHEISQGTGFQIVLESKNIPVRPTIQSVCEILGYDPMYLACEGRVVAVVAPEQAEEALRRWRSLNHGTDAHIVGEVREGQPLVTLRTELGGERILQELEDDPLPRIC